MKLLALTVLAFLSSNSWAQTTCTKTWPDVLTKIKDLRKLNACGPEYTLKECQSNLGLVGLAGATGAAAKIKKLKLSAPTSCGLIGLQNFERTTPESFVEFLMRTQLPYAHAAPACGLKNFDAEKKEALAVIEERKEALQKELEATEKSSGSSFEKTVKKHARLRQLHEMRADAIRGYMNHVGGPLRPEDLKQAVANIDAQIESYIKTAYVTSEEARQEVRAASRALERSSMTGDMADGAAEFAAQRSGGGSNAGKIQALKDQLQKMNVAEQALTGPGSVLPQNFAKGLEAAAQDLPGNELNKIANIRMKFAEKFPNITMSRSSKLAVEGFRSQFDKAKKKLIAKPKMVGKVPMIAKIGGGVMGAAISGITLAAETTDEGRTDALSGIVDAKSTGCAARYSEWATIDEECRISKEWDTGIAAFVELDEASIQSELEGDSNGDICQHILDMHKKYFSPSTKASCSGNSVIIKDDSARQNYIASWDSSGALTSFKFNGEYKNNRGYTMGFKNGAISSIEHKGPIFSGSITGEELKGNQHAADFAEHFSTASPRVMELQACCMGSISDARCSAIKGPQGSSGSGGLGGAGSGSNSNSGSGAF